MHFPGIPKPAFWGALGFCQESCCSVALLAFSVQIKKASFVFHLKELPHNY